MSVQKETAEIKDCIAETSWLPIDQGHFPCAVRRQNAPARRRLLHAAAPLSSLVILTDRKRAGGDSEHLGGDAAGCV